MTKLIAFVLAASLCVGSASAIDVYEVDQDSRPLMMMANSGVSTAAVSDSWYSSVLQNLEWIMFDIDQISSDTGSISSIDRSLSDIAFALGTYADAGTVFGYLRDLCEWLGVYDAGASSLPGLIDDIGASIGVLDTDFLIWAAGFDSSFADLLSDVSSIDSDVSLIYDSLDDLLLDTSDLVDYLDDLVTISDDSAAWMGVYDGGLQLNELLVLLDDSVVAFHSGFSDWVVDWASHASSLIANLRQSAGNPVLNTSGWVSNMSSDFSLSTLTRMGFLGLGALFRGGSGTPVLNTTGGISNLTSDLSFFTLSRMGFLGLGSLLRESSGLPVLNTAGGITNLTSNLSLVSLVRIGLLGLSENIKSISSGSYSLSLFDSDTASSSTVSASTMGNMIHQYFNSMQDDLGALTFIHADSEAVQAKKDAANNTAAVTDSFLKPGSAGSVGVSDIGNAAEAVSGTKELFETGVSIGQAFDQLQGSGPLEFFTAQTAANLNTVPATYSDDDDFVHFYDPSNSEFFELIGKGGN